MYSLNYSSYMDMQILSLLILFSIIYFLAILMKEKVKSNG